MNSMSKHFKDDCETCKKPHEEHSRKCRKVEEQEFILLKVGNPQNTTIPSTSVNGNVFTVATLTANIPECLDDPEIKVDFTTNILIGAATPSAGGTLVFQVNKFFINSFNPTNSITVGPTWNYSNPDANEADILSFFVKDDDEFDGGIVKYTVTATVAGLATSVTTLGGPYTLNNSTLAVEVAAEEEERG